MVTPLNTQKNRELELVPYTGDILQIKKDFVFLKFRTELGDIYIKCEKGLFKRNFRTDENIEIEKVGNEKDVKHTFSDFLTMKKL